MAVDPPFRIKNMVPGMIMLWHGSIASIPSGWHLCDGTMGTPDLLGWFVRGAGGPYTPGSVGGASGHFHDFTGDGHTHTFVTGPKNRPVDGASYSELSTNPAVGQSTYKDSKPPYRQLCYIMKL